MKNKELGKRLKDARKTVGFTLGEAAKRLGFSNYQTLSKIETGEREVKASELPLFAKTYFCGVSSLLGEKEIRPTISLLWRKAPPGPKKKEIEGQVFYLCKQYHLLETLLGLKEEEEFRFLAINIGDIRTNSDIDILADKARNLLGLGNRPAFALQKVLEQLYSVKILYRPLSDIGSAASMMHPEYGAVVVINTDETPWRRNYDLAHELFHLITWKVVSLEDLEGERFFQDIEKKAERFASTLLLPEMEVVREISIRIKAQKTISYSDLIDIARDFGVSTVALLYRLANLRLLKWEDADKMVKDEELSGLDKQIRRKEWGEEPISERFYSLAVRCLRKGLISRGKFAEMVAIDRSEIDDFIENCGLMKIEGTSVEIMAP